MPESRRPLPLDTFGAWRLTRPTRHASTHTDGGTDPLGGLKLCAPDINSAALELCGLSGQVADIFTVSLTDGGTNAMRVRAGGSVKFGPDVTTALAPQPTLFVNGGVYVGQPNDVYHYVRVESENDASNNWTGSSVWNYGVGTPFFYLSSARGTRTTPAPMLSGDILGGMYVDAYATATQQAAAYWQVEATENWGAANKGAKWDFYVSPTGSFAAPTKIMTLLSDAAIIGASDPAPTDSRPLRVQGAYLVSVGSGSPDDGFSLVYQGNNDFGGMGVMSGNDAGGNWTELSAANYGLGVPYLWLGSSRGTVAAPSPTLVNDVLGVAFFAGRASAGAWASASANIRAVAEENFGTGANGTRLDFYVVQNTTAIERNVWRMTNSGNFLALQTGLNIGASGGNRPSSVYVDNLLCAGADPGGTGVIRGTGNLRLAGRIQSVWGTDGVSTDEHFTFGKAGSPVAGNPYYTFKTDGSAVARAFLQGYDGTTSTTLMLWNFENGRVQARNTWPLADLSYNLGDSSARWITVYAARTNLLVSSTSGAPDTILITRLSDTPQADQADPFTYYQSDGSTVVSQLNFTGSWTAVGTAHRFGLQGTVSGSPVLSLLGGTVQLVVGDSVTNGAVKAARIGIEHFTVANNPGMLIGGQSTSGATTVYLGGGLSGMNAATNMQYYTGSTVTTATGTLRAEWTNAGQVTVYGSDTTQTYDTKYTYAAQGTLRFRRAQGTRASPTALASGNVFGSIQFEGAVNTTPTYALGAEILARTTQAWGASARGSEIVFSTTDNSTSTLDERWTIEHDGHLTPAADNTLDIGTSSLHLRALYSDELNTVGVEEGWVLDSTGDVVTRDPATQAAAGFISILVDGARRYVPFYTAS